MLVCWHPKVRDSWTSPQNPRWHCRVVLQRLGGNFYPPGMLHRKQHPLEILARCFDMVEVNTSFYGHIKPHLAKLWVRKAEAVNPDFMFTAKLHRSFTHNPMAVMEPTSAASIKPNDEDEALAREGLEALAERGS